MKDLKQLVINKISELGDDKAAEYFGKSKQSLQGWKRPNGVIPLAAVQQVLADQPAETGGTLGEVADGDVKITPIQEASVLPEPLILSLTNEEIERRLTKLEDFARAMTDPDRQQQTSFVRPAPPPTPQPVPQPPSIFAVDAPTPTPVDPDLVSPKMSDILRPRPLPARR